eukprot:GEMP01104519.1.p1 GENE.GEMP01104519.1~~GEMP01104519.1.p1  ORF type:complete len:111 (-),score=11.07 GEMP01104519.1:242-574(-)
MLFIALTTFLLGAHAEKEVNINIDLDGPGEKIGDSDLEKCESNAFGFFGWSECDCGGFSCSVAQYCFVEGEDSMCTSVFTSWKVTLIASVVVSFLIGIILCCCCLCCCSK